MAPFSGERKNSIAKNDTSVPDYKVIATHSRYRYTIYIVALVNLLVKVRFF